MNIAPDKIDTFLNAYSKTISIESGLENNDGKEINVADIIEDEKHQQLMKLNLKT